MNPSAAGSQDIEITVSPNPIPLGDNYATVKAACSKCTEQEFEFSVVEPGARISLNQDSTRKAPVRLSHRPRREVLPCERATSTATKAGPRSACSSNARKRAPGGRFPG